MRRSVGRDLVLVVTAIVAFAAAMVVSDHIAARRVTVPESYSDEDLDLQGKKLKGFALGSEGLIADWYWMRSLQYVGDKIVAAPEDMTINVDDLRSLNPRLLYPMLDNATDLDPKFIDAYIYGMVLLPAINPSQAIKLGEKGIEQNPDEYRLYQYLGYTYWRLKQYEKAAEVYDRGSRIANAPPFLKLMAGMMKTRGDDRNAARSIYADMYQNASDEQIRRVARLRLLWLDSLDERDLLNSVLTNFKQRNGRCARNLGEIVQTLSSMPAAESLRIDRSGQIVDPSDVPYELDPSACRATVSRNSTIPKD